MSRMPCGCSAIIQLYGRAFIQRPSAAVYPPARQACCCAVNGGGESSKIACFPLRYSLVIPHRYCGCRECTDRQYTCARSALRLLRADPTVALCLASRVPLQLALSLALPATFSVHRTSGCPKLPAVTQNAIQPRDGCTRSVDRLWPVASAGYSRLQPTPLTVAPHSLSQALGDTPTGVLTAHDRMSDASIGRTRRPKE
jgi:hypothetical protein